MPLPLMGSSNICGANPSNSGSPLKLATRSLSIGSMPTRIGSTTWRRDWLPVVIFLYPPSFLHHKTRRFIIYSFPARTSIHNNYPRHKYSLAPHRKILTLVYLLISFGHVEKASYFEN